MEFETRKVIEAADLGLNRNATAQELVLEFVRFAEAQVLRWIQFPRGILLFLGVALALSASFVVLPMVVAKFTGASKPYAEKLAEYECGFPAFEDSRAQFDVRFYLIAILFIIFDLEVAFLFPWAVALKGLG